MFRKYLSVSKKLVIVSAAELSGSVMGTARVNSVQPNQIRQWRRDKEKLIEKTKNCKALTVHSITVARFNLERIPKPDYPKFIQKMWTYK